MFYKGIIFDLDNTIYDYEYSHKIALINVLNYLTENTSISYEDLMQKYEEITQSVKYELKNTASSHNKSIYFKHIIKEFDLNYSLFSVINETYWKTFYENMKCYEGVINFILWNKKNGIKIGILTDYETEYQIMKLEKLGLLDLIDVIATSEEVGIEKPSIQMFQTILTRMGLSSTEVIIVGDNYEKDIQGAINAKIFGYWFHKNNVENDKYIEFNSFTNLLTHFHVILDELNKFSELSRFCGERFDLVQAGGGNSSVKINDWMFIKASGYHLTNISTKNGYAIINNKKLLNDIQNHDLKQVTDYNIINKIRPSIETFMHSILKKYTVHLHPLQTNRILISNFAEEIVKELFPDSLIIKYLTPGIKVCNEIKRNYNNENIIFLINHGIIITSDDYNEIYILLEKVITTFENYQKLNFDKYKFTNILSKYIKKQFNVDCISYLCENKTIYEYLLLKPQLLKERITFPDALIYCGIEISIINKVDELIEYYKKNNELPKIIIIDENIYIIGIHLNKCKEIEDVLCSNLIILDSEYNKNYLSIEEICFLNNWDAEKYRKII
jgi:FMN phosphatase YigB (HAD superfamily)/ribulose-5-phosphate 4-epimerase/fuculose-1-phosphate aldolase